MIRLLIVEDHRIVRESLRFLLNNMPDFEVVCVAENGLQALASCDTLHPDLVLMDIHMPELDGVEATRRLKARWPEIKVIILTSYEEVEYVTAALTYGAEGYLLKAISPENLAAAIRLVHQGGTLVPQEIAVRLIQAASAPKTVSQYGLTAREMDVLQCIAHGLNNREISERLYLSEGTVKNYISALYSKLEVKNRSEAKKKASAEGLL